MTDAHTPGPSGTPSPEPSRDIITHAFQIGLGPWLTPLRGKIPVYDAWTDRAPVCESDVREYVEIGYNLGFRTGAGSGFVVIDDDQAKHDIPDERRYVPPPTDLIAESPTGGRHYYYRAPNPCPGNSVGRIAPYVDVRGEGGQVVYPGSIHPTEKRPYRWMRQGEPGTFPEDVLAQLRPSQPLRVDMTKTDVPRGTSGGGAGGPTPGLGTARPGGSGPTRPSPGSPDAYAQTALHREVHAVRTAPEGARNDTLNRAGFSLGQLVAGGALDEAAVHSELTAAASLAGLQEREIQSTLASALRAGAQQPRRAPERPAVASATVSTPAPPRRAGVLVPGSHVLPGGEYRKQANNDFALDVLRALPPGSLYRRAGTIGEILDTFMPVSIDRIRCIVDRHVSLKAGKESKKKDDDGETRPVLVDRTCSRDHAGLVLAEAQATAVNVRDLRYVAAHPVCVGRGCRVAPQGWDEESGTYRIDSTKADPLPLDAARAVLEDLVADFPFATQSDRANYFGLLLTPLLRPALHEPVPMHLIGSPVERCGKTKLAEVVLGCTITGAPIGAMQLGRDEDEHDKRITSALRAGHTIIHLDNLHDALDSAPLASLLTSSVYQGRTLGKSDLVSIPNGLTVVGTGNNVHATGEIAKRVVPITLQPASEAPETREDYRHPDIRGYAVEQRERTLGALLGLVEAWRDAGRPLGSVGFGGFERWASVLGGIMRVAGYPEWLGNLAAWRGVADDFNSEVGAFVKAWHERWACSWVPAADLFALAIDELGLFGAVQRAKNEQGRRISFGLRVLDKLPGRMLPGGMRATSDGRGSKRRICLVYAGDTDLAST